jgi:hypothetical protein
MFKGKFMQHVLSMQHVLATQAVLSTLSVVHGVALVAWFPSGMVRDGI